MLDWRDCAINSCFLLFIIIIFSNKWTDPDSRIEVITNHEVATKDKALKAPAVKTEATTTTEVVVAIRAFPQEVLTINKAEGAPTLEVAEEAATDQVVSLKNQSFL